MKRETTRTFKDLAYYSSIGLSVSFAVIIGLFLGVWLDKKFSTDPWLMLAGLGLGIAAGYRNIGHMIRKIKKADNE